MQTHQVLTSASGRVNPETELTVWGESEAKINAHTSRSES